MSRLSTLALLSVLLTTTPADAAVFVMPGDSELIRNSDAIVIGTVTNLRAEFDEDESIVTVIELEIEDVLKGAIDPAKAFWLREPGGIIGDFATVVSGAPHYWIGNRALIFLERGDEGHWNTWGMSLGKFDFVRDTNGRQLSVRWATDQTDVLVWRPDGKPHEEKLRDAAGFIDFIREFVKAIGEPGRRGKPFLPTAHEAPREPGYFVDHITADEISFLPPVTHAHYPPSAYTSGTFRWDVFDKGGAVTYRTSGSQPGYDSAGAAQRAAAAWTNDPGSNVNLQIGGTTTAGFVQDSINAIVFNSSTDVPSGSVGYARWFASGTHTYKGETFYSIVEGDVVVKSGLTVTQKVFDEIVTHEVGHTIGLRHSDQGTPGSNEAVMKTILTGNYGATLGPWDVEAVRHVYEQAATSIGIPTNVVATATSTSRVVVSWSPVAGATQYQVYRRTSITATPVLAGTVTGTSFTDTGLAAGTTYIYTVRAVAAGVTSPDSPMDHATTIIFTDDPLVPRVTVIKAVHLIEIRNAVNAVRVAAGLPAAGWTDPSPAGVVVKAVHINELRNALAPALTALGKAATFTDDVTPLTPIRGVHFQELRNQTK